MGSDYDAFAKLAGIAAAAGRMYANDGILYAKGETGSAGSGEGASGRLGGIKNALENLLYNSC